MGKVRDVLRMFVPSVTAFFLGGIVMALGLVVSRLAATALGASLYTWTSIVGILLVGLAVGGVLGGRIADRYHPRRTLAVLFGLSSAACVGVITLHNLLASHGAWLWRLSWPGHVFLHVGAMLFLPSVLLGATAPALARMALREGADLGRAVGILCAAGTTGGAAGMLLTGFFLIPSYGTIAIIWMLGAALLGMALVYWTSCWALYLWAMVFAALMTMGMAPAQWAREGGISSFLREANDPNVAYQDDTPYGHIAVRQMSDRPDRRSFRTGAGRPSDMVIGEVTRLGDFHHNVWAGLTRGLVEGNSAGAMLVVGGRDYAFPRYLKACWPESRVRVIEVDPGVTEAARRAGNLGEQAPIETINMDVRHYLGQLRTRGQTNGSLPRYDLIFADMRPDEVVPIQPVTREFNEAIASLLTDDGVYMLSLIDGSEGTQFLGAVVGTLEQTFSHVDVITERIERPEERSPFVIVASRRTVDAKRFLEAYDERLEFRLLDIAEITRLKERSDFLVLTDDYAPVENLLASTVRLGAAERFARRCLRQAERLRAQRHYDQSAQRYQQAAKLNPSVAIEAWNSIGVMRLAQGDLRAAAKAFREAVGYEDDAGPQTVMVASAGRNLAAMLDKAGYGAEARKYRADAVKSLRSDLARHPNSVVSWDWLGDTLDKMGDLNGAAEAFGRAMALEPKNVTYYEKLAKVLERQKRYGEAIVVAKKHVSLLKEMGQRDVAILMGTYVDYLEYQKVKQHK